MAGRYNPVFSIVCHDAYDNVVNRAKSLENRFDKMIQEQVWYSSEVKALLVKYVNETIVLESMKLDSVISASMMELENINEHYNNRRLNLISRMEEKLNDFTNPRHVNWSALDLMEMWYAKNKHFPYPTEKDVIQISKDGGIPRKSVETWFYYKRLCARNGEKS